MHENQHDTIQRWRRLVEHVRNDVLPPRNGRLVESRGDSMILTFPKPDDAVKSAFAIKQFCGTLNEGMPPQRHFLLRTAIHVGV